MNPTCEASVRRESRSGSGIELGLGGLEVRVQALPWNKKLFDPVLEDVIHYVLALRILLIFPPADL